jgi:hypothetical protein
VSQPQYPYGNPHDPASQPPSDPYQQAGYSPFPDPAYPDPAYQQATYPVPQQYPPTEPYQGYPGYPPPPPPRRGPTILIVTVVALLLVVVVGGGIAAAYLLPKDKQANAQSSQGTGPSGGSSSGAGSPSTAASASPTPDAGPTHGGDLRTFLVGLPSGLKKCPNEEGTNNALNLDQAAKLSSDEDKRRQELQEYKFLDGAVRCWVAANGSVVDVRLYRFDSTSNASDFFDADINGTSPGYTADDITPVAGVPGAKTFAKPDKDSNGYTRVISIGRNGDVVLVIAMAETTAVDIKPAEDLLVQQYQKL